MPTVEAWRETSQAEDARRKPPRDVASLACITSFARLILIGYATRSKESKHIKALLIIPTIIASGKL